MTICFKYNVHDNDIIDTYITLWTNSKYIHAQIIFSNGEVGSSWIDTGVAFKTTDETIIYPYLFSYIKVEIDEISEMKMHKFIEGQLGKKFDMLGSLIPFVNRKDRWHCSELCYQTLKEGGVINNDTPAEKITPQNLYDILKEKGYNIIN